MIRAEGAAAACERLGGIAEAIPRELAAAVRMETDALEAEAKRRCPVITGRLRNSIRSSVRESEAGAEAIVGSGLDYAAAVELGTPNQPPRPFLAPALRARGDALPESVRQAVRRALKG